MTRRRFAPLHLSQPRVLGGAAVVAAAVGVGLVLSSAAPSAPPQPVSAAAPAAPAPTGPPVAPTTTVDADDSAAPTVADPVSTTTLSSTPPSTPRASSSSSTGWEVAARGFATAFTATPTAGQDWLATLIPWISPALATSLAATDPTRRPAGTLLQLQATTETADLVVATATYDTGLQLALTLTPTTEPGPGWVVSTVLQVPAG